MQDDLRIAGVGHNMNLRRKRVETMIGARAKTANQLPRTVFIWPILLASVALNSSGSALAESDARRFAAYALALRVSAVAGGDAAVKVLANMPGAGPAGAVPILWRPFFDNATVRLGRPDSSVPAALYYNPLLDVAVLTLWEKRKGGYRVVSVRALPGERLVDPRAEAPLRPPWMASEDGPVQALTRIAASRLSAFGHAYAAEAKAGAGDGTTFAAAAADFRAALPRLVWNAARRAQWTAGTEPWLAPALSRIEEALAARTPSAIAAAAPDTDNTTAAALASLPETFVEGLALDMALDAGGGERLLIGSLPDDGDVYVLVLCRIDGDDCALRRFVLMSLSE